MLKALTEISKDPRVESVEDSRDRREGLWIHLEAGWIDPNTRCHSVHEDTLPRLLAAFKAIKPCDCEDCSDSLAR